MSRLEQEHDVIALARELGLRGNPVEAIVRYCQDKIDEWVEGVGEVNSIAELESLVADKLQLVFEEIYSDEDLERLIVNYVAQGEIVFAALRNDLDASTFGATIRRKHPGPKDKYVAVIDCRRGKAARRFFTRWHEIAHLLVLEKELVAPVRRSSDTPLERLMDEIAGQIGFYEPLFGPVFAREHRQAPLEFKTVDAIRVAYCNAASFQSTLFACHRRLSTPAVYLEAEMKYKADEERRLRSPRKEFQSEPPIAKLRVGLAMPNQVATDRGFRISPNMRVPEGSIIYKLHSNASADQSSGRENLGTWEFSDGSSLPDCQVWVDARKAGDRVIAIVQPTNGIP